MPSKKTNNKLNVNFDIPFLVIGISTSEKIFVASIEINKILKLNLSLTKSIELNRINNITFNTFSFYNQDNDLNYFFISNKSKDGYLLDSYKNIDYLFIISGKENELLNKQELIKTIKSEIFLVVTELKINNKKEKEFFNNILYQLLTE